jgi:hypothetical protein
VIVSDHSARIRCSPDPYNQLAGSALAKPVVGSDVECRRICVVVVGEVGWWSRVKRWSLKVVVALA